MPATNAISTVKDCIMNIRRITSLTAFLSFFIVLLTSVILYIVPQGRVAYWADWRLWSLSKEQWGAIHINVGVLFLFALSLHIYYNWKPIVLYLKNKARRLRIFTKDFNVAALFVLCFIIGSYSDIPPFSTIITISDEIKEAAARTYKRAGVTDPKTAFDVIEVSDQYAYQLPMWMEGLGMVDEGKAGQWIDDNGPDTLHVNLSGGMLEWDKI